MDPRFNKWFGIRAVAALAGLGLSLLGALPTQGEEPDAAALERGEILVSSQAVAGSRVPEFVVRGLVEAPPASVWPLLDQCGRYQQLFERVKAAAELERQGTRVVCRMEIDLPFPFADLWHESECVHESLGQGRFSRRWKMLRGTYRANEGSWTLSPWGEGAGRTLVVYRVLAEPDSSLPEGVRAHFQKSSLPKMIAALRRRIARP
jgi:ribosome-associated toxin RatA of RatAB toxin-antitoxin module